VREPFCADAQRILLSHMTTTQEDLNTTTTTPRHRRSWRTQGSIGNPLPTAFKPVDDTVQAVKRLREALLPLKEAADHAYAAAKAEDVLPSERAQLELAAADAAELVKRAEAEIADAMQAVADTAREHRHDIDAHADALRDKARKKSAAALQKLEQAERERREAESIAAWLTEVSTGQPVTFRQATDTTGAHVAAISDAITGPARQRDDYARVMEWLDANQGRLLPPLAAASMFPQLMLPSEVAQMLGVEVTTVQAAHAAWRRKHGQR